MRFSEQISDPTLVSTDATRNRFVNSSCSLEKHHDTKFQISILIFLGG